MDKQVQQDMMHWDFERYASVILYINGYYEHYMSAEQRATFESLGEDVKFGIPVTKQMLEKLDLDETLEEFCNEAQIMQDEMNSDEDMLLIELECKDDQVTLYIDPFILSIFTEQEAEDEEV